MICKKCNNPINFAKDSIFIVDNEYNHITCPTNTLTNTEKTVIMCEECKDIGFVWSGYGFTSCFVCKKE